MENNIKSFFLLVGIAVCFGYPPFMIVFFILITVLCIANALIEKLEERKLNQKP